MSSVKLERTERESKDGRAGKKRRIEIDFEKLLSSNGSTDGDDDPPPELVVVKSSAIIHCDDRSEKGVERPQGENGEQEQEREDSSCLNLPEEIVRLQDRELHEKIRTLAKSIKRYSPTLPDKGDKFKALLKQHQEEERRRERSRSSKDATGCSKPALSGSSRQSGATHASKQDPPMVAQSSAQSQFGFAFRKKLEGNKGSRTCDTFGFELETLGRGGRNRIEQKGLDGPHRGEKCPLPLKGKDQIDLSSEEVFIDRKNLADTNSISQSRPRRSLRQKAQKSKKTVFLSDDEEEPESYVHKEDDSALRGTSIFYPTGEDLESVEIRYDDLQCLAPGVYLTSTIMNFYIRYLQVSLSLIKNDYNDYHFFNTYFYKKLQEAISQADATLNSLFVKNNTVKHKKCIWLLVITDLNLSNSDCAAIFNKLRRWWKGINIFQKAYIFLPIHDNLHWSLVIICIPDKADESGPIILHLDSLGYHNSRSIFQNVKRLLKEEWNYLKGQADPPNVPMADSVWEQLPRRIDESIITVPQQNNDSDCGPFVLFFMERFISEAPRRLRKQDLSMFGEQWFKPAEASSLRAKIRKLLMEEFNKSKTTHETADQLSDRSASEIL